MFDLRSKQAEIISQAGLQALDEHLASLRYAGMIQHALMPDDELLAGVLKDYFVMFLPRDIVSGDFYYAFPGKEYLCLAAGDCTGHGVPGALLSILGISFLNEILQSVRAVKANRVLNLMREKVMKALHQTGDRAETKDSIDIALCIVEYQTGKMQYAGANRPLVVVRNGHIIEYKPDFMTIGLAPVAERAFKNNYIDIFPDDQFYLFSDGFADQFGEKTNKKLKNKNFRKILEIASGIPEMSAQKAYLEKKYYEWKGNMTQIDDVLVFGFKL
ncbi:MAG TPA: SpoIIE family protein phosphatase [Bacteroidales bacterium]|nr:SpoIIE family protein phosphatase [Bacteroidales bacterium]HPP93129.1 SpoIIE family protein phosphatase [Bacteroidales bacterium]